MSMNLFFFSSRRRHTRWPRDWSSDVCSSDLIGEEVQLSIHLIVRRGLGGGIHFLEAERRLVGLGPRRLRLSRSLGGFDLIQGAHFFVQCVQIDSADIKVGIEVLFFV